MPVLPEIRDVCRKADDNANETPGLPRIGLSAERPYIAGYGFLTTGEEKFTLNT